jgi:hypothetical protein
MFHRERRCRELVSCTRRNEADDDRFRQKLTMTDFDKDGREMHPRSNEPSAEGRWWIARALEIEYGSDAPVTEFARALWQQSLAARQAATGTSRG